MDATPPPTPADSSAVPVPPKPTGFWNSLLTTLPIVLTILATAFAGLSSSEMTQAMYYRSLAAQQQSKAGDQWAFFQAKRIRGTSLEMTAELLQSLAHPAPFDPTKIDELCGQLLAELDNGNLTEMRGRFRKVMAGESIKQNLSCLTGPTLPKSEVLSLENKAALSGIEEAVKAIRKRKTEMQTAELIRKLAFNDIEEATRLAEENADNFDEACQPIAELIDAFRTALAGLHEATRPLQPIGAGPAARQLAALGDQEKGFKLAALRFDALRYRKESTLNRAAAEMYEVRVRRSGLESDRHRERSKMFFYSMLVAQMGVTVASLALARQQRKSLWLFAAAAGVVSLGFTGYIYLTF